MSLPDEITLSITINGLSFDLRVAALRQGSELLFPDRICADEFHIAPDLQRGAVQAVACALDAAAREFQKEFYAALSKVLSKAIEVNKEAA